MKNKDMPAMPFVDPGFGQYQPEVVSGLTKREMIAMNAMSAMLSSQYVSDFNKDGNSDNDAYCSMHKGIAVEAIKYADALLAELDK